MSQPEVFRFISSAPNSIERQRRIANLRHEFDQQQQQSNFSSSYDYDNLTDLENGFPELDSVSKVRRVTENELARQSAVEPAKKLNELWQRNRANKPKFPTDKQGENWRGW